MFSEIFTLQKTVDELVVYKSNQSNLQKQVNELQAQFSQLTTLVLQHQDYFSLQRHISFSCDTKIEDFENYFERDELKETAVVRPKSKLHSRTESSDIKETNESCSSTETKDQSSRYS